jgi:hypothetical protein
MTKRKIDQQLNSQKNNDKRINNVLPKKKKKTIQKNRK